MGWFGISAKAWISYWWWYFNIAHDTWSGDCKWNDASPLTSEHFPPTAHQTHRCPELNTSDIFWLKFVAADSFLFSHLITHWNDFLCVKSSSVCGNLCQWFAVLRCFLRSLWLLKFKCGYRSITQWPFVSKTVTRLFFLVLSSRGARRKDILLLGFWCGNFPT